MLPLGAGAIEQVRIPEDVTLAGGAPSERTDDARISFSEALVAIPKKADAVVLETMHDLARILDDLATEIRPKNDVDCECSVVDLRKNVLVDREPAADASASRRR